MTPLSDALTAAQRSALAALEKAYVAGAIEKEELTRQMSLVGLTDTVDGTFLIAALDVLKEWGVAAPTMTERVARENGPPEKASKKQEALIIDLCRRKNIKLPDIAGVSKAQASEIIDSLNDGSYDPAKWTVPF